MNVSLVEPHPQRVLEAFRAGEFDELEVIGQADEKEFFELCFRKKMLESLAQSMPTARKKEEVPRWFILAANLTLKRHGENAYLGFERVVRCGGLLQALDPAIASKHLDPQSQRWFIHCQGFNDKNDYERTTPCDQDFLRKVSRDVAAEAWLGWFNGAVQEVFQSQGFFDPEGIFIGDAPPTSLCRTTPPMKARCGCGLMNTTTRWITSSSTPRPGAGWCSDGVTNGSACCIGGVRVLSGQRWSWCRATPMRMVCCGGWSISLSSGWAGA